MKLCPRCNARYSNEAVFCGEDGADLVAVASRQCDLCGAEVEANASHCHSCGSRLHGAVAQAAVAQAAVAGTSAAYGAPFSPASSASPFASHAPRAALPIVVGFAAATALGLVAGIWLTNQWYSPLSFILLYLAIGAAQWLVLRSFSGVSAWWILATAIGFFAAFKFADTLMEVVFDAVLSASNYQSISLAALLSNIAVGAVVGSIVGGAQWFVVRPSMPLAPWIGASALSLAAAGALNFFIRGNNYFSFYGVSLFSSLLIGFAMGVPQAWVLARWAPPRRAPMAGVTV